MTVNEPIHIVVSRIEDRHHRSCVVVCSRDEKRLIDLDSFRGVPVAARDLALAARLQDVQYVSCN